MKQIGMSKKPDGVAQALWDAILCPEAAGAAAELAFHRSLCRQLQNAFLRKTLESIAETYLLYGAACPGHDTERALTLLRRAAWSEPEQALREYYDDMTETIMGARAE